MRDTLPEMTQRATASGTSARGLRFTLLACATLMLAACETNPLQSIGLGSFGAEEDSAEAMAGDQSGGEAAQAETAVSAQDPKIGQVIEVITPDSGAASQAVAPVAAPENAESQGESVAALPPEPGVPAIDDDPQQLIGMGPASLNALLGAPELIRREAPASLWQYRVEGCVLDVVLYPDRQGDKVTYLEARETDATKISPRACLGKLLRARQNGGSAG